MHNGKNRKELFIRLSFFLVILYIFSKLWQATQFLDPTNAQSMIWYLSVTELIVLSVPFIQVDIENDIRTGDVVYHLLKPMNYLWLKMLSSIGSFLFRFLILILISFPFCTYLSGFIPPLPSLLASYFTAAIAGLVFILFQTTIGLLAFKLQDSTPIFWLWQRCSFLCGGLIIPLDFYPPYFKKAAYFLPFASLLYGPGSLIISFRIEHLILVLGGLLFWGSVSFFLAKGIYNRILKKLTVNGG